MAKNSVADWDTDPDNNTDIGGTNIGEGCAPSGINNALRKVMAQAKSGFATESSIGDVTTKGSLVDGDQFLIFDSAASNARKKTLWSTLKSTLKTYFDTIYAATAHTHSNATTSVAGFMAAADKTKLDGIASGATANSSNATLLARANHTGTQAISTVSGLQTALDGKASTSHAHSAADITSGTLAVARGGTGGASASAARTSLGVYSTAEVDAKTWSATDITSGTLPIARGGTGETTEAGMRGVYTGTSSTNTVFEIGSTLLVRAAGATRNASITVRIDGSVSGAYQSASGTALSGTWRVRGVDQSGDTALAQRVA